MGALAYYLEEEGIPTTQISLIREHTEFIRPPRALWVPFELGHPLGAPENPMLQRRVLLAALGLLEAPAGPVLADFPDEVPESPPGTDQEPAVWACPVSFAPHLKEETDREKLRSAFRREVAELRPWYDLSFERSGRTTMGNFAPESASKLLDSYAFSEALERAGQNLPIAVVLRLAAHDLKAFYFEAAIARPGSTPPGSAEFNRWFWTETAAGRVLKAVQKRCMNEEDKALRMTGAMLLVPLGQA
ncbi:MAG TPA: hypothetical protein DCZ97_07610 [Syntrophus sp. (in: bacteria)]|nr:hypothetical protein [Syntrophus sp. (in: bacteria)]